MAFARLVGSSWQELSGDITVGDGDDAVRYPAGWLDGADEEQLIALGVAEIVEEPDVPPCLQLLGQAIVDVNGVPHRRWVLPPAADVRANRRAEVASLRYARQQSMKWRGRIALADDTTAGRIVAAVVLSQVTANPTASFLWKFGDGDFDTISLADLEAYGGAIAAHWQACFAREAELVTAIAAASDPAAICAIDLTGGWPA